MKRILSILVIAGLLCACLPAVADDYVFAFDESLNLVWEGETLQTVLNRAGDAAEGEVTFSSWDTRVATMDQKGVVTGLKKGKTTISALLKTGKRTYRALLKLTIGRKATDVRLDTSALRTADPTDERLAGLLSSREDPAENELPVILLPVKKATRLTAKLVPADATGRSVVLSSSDPSVLTAGRDSVTGVKPGEAVLTAAWETDPSVQRKYRVLVIQPVTSLKITSSVKDVPAGQQITLTAEALPETATFREVVWVSEDERIAAVTPGGVVTGVKKGTVRLNAMAADGSGAHTGLTIRVGQNPEQITFRNEEVTLNTGRNLQLQAIVFPRNADDRSVTWASSDEQIATVNSRGRVTAVAPGSCEIVCSSRVVPEVKASVTVHVKQPVTSIAIDPPQEIWAGGGGQLTWTVEPANASDPAVKMTSANEQVLTVDDSGKITALKAGEAYVTVMATDGSNRRARIRVKVLQHVEGVRMRRKTAYINLTETATAGAILEPANASDHRMSWSAADTDIVAVRGEETRVQITGRKYGTTTITGKTEDGGFETSMDVIVGEWDESLKLTEASARGTSARLRVKNVSDLTITSVTAEVVATDAKGKPVACNKKDGSNKFTMVYSHTLSPGASSRDAGWKTVNFEEPEEKPAWYEIRVVEFQIDNDWVKVIRKHKPLTKKCPVR